MAYVEGQVYLKEYKVYEAQLEPLRIWLSQSGDLFRPGIWMFSHIYH